MASESFGGRQGCCLACSWEEKGGRLELTCSWGLIPPASKCRPQSLKLCGLALAFTLLQPPWKWGAAWPVVQKPDLPVLVSPGPSHLRAVRSLRGTAQRQDQQVRVCGLRRHSEELRSSAIQRTTHIQTGIAWARFDPENSHVAFDA